jgi:hypothetical protein
MSLIFNFDAAIPKSPSQIDPRNPVEVLAFVGDVDETRRPKNNEKNKAAKGLGSWYFDKKTRKRKYISLTGKTLYGPAAVQQSRMDKVR